MKEISFILNIFYILTQSNALISPTKNSIRQIHQLNGKDTALTSSAYTQTNYFCKYMIFLPSSQTWEARSTTPCSNVVYL